MNTTDTMPNDTVFRRAIRPGLLIYFTAIFTFVMFADGNLGEFTVKTIYIGVLETILVTIYGAFYLGRSGEKITHIKQSGKGVNYDV